MYEFVIIFLIGTIVVLTVCVFIFQHKVKLVNEVTLRVLDTQFKAFDQGMSEQEENYEMQFLSMHEELEALRHVLWAQNEELEYHRSHCLPDLRRIRIGLN